jgi:hypothetical protein
LLALLGADGAALLDDAAGKVGREEEKEEDDNAA